MGRGPIRVCYDGRMAKRSESEREKALRAGILLSERLAEERLGGAAARHTTKRTTTTRAPKGIQR